MKRLLLVSMLAVSAISTNLAPASAQEITGLAVSPGSTVLTVSGEGKITRKPDFAMFTAGVATTGQTAGEALSGNSAAMSRVIRALKAAGIADRDIQTSNLSINPVYRDRRPDPQNVLEEQLPQIIGYRANNQVIVKQRKLGEFGKVIDTLVSAGANQVNGPSFQIENPEDALDTARQQAVTKARERADLYAQAAGLRIVRILSITESGGYSPRPNIAAYARAADTAESTPVAEGEVEMQTGVRVLYELAP